MEEPIIGFNCRDYGQFKTSPSPNMGSYFSMTLEDNGLEISETQVIGVRRLVLKVETFEKMLKEFIEEEEPKTSEYGSLILYPTQQAKSVILALVKEVRKLKKGEKAHGFLHG